MPKKTPRRAMNGRDRWEVVEEEGDPRGDVYQLEVETTYCVVDRTTGAVVLSFCGHYSSTLDDNGAWGPGKYFGVDKVEISDDGTEAIVHDSGGGIRRVALPLGKGQG